jgi:hypothetical protein
MRKNVFGNVWDQLMRSIFHSSGGVVYQVWDAIIVGDNDSIDSMGLRSWCLRLTFNAWSGR